VDNATKTQLDVAVFEGGGSYKNFSTMKEAEDAINSRVLANKDRLDTAKREKATALDEKFKPLKLRSGTSRKVNINEIPHELKSVTQFADAKRDKVYLKPLTGEPSKRKLRTEIADKDVRQWAQNLTDKDQWPQGKSLEGYEKWLRLSYNKAGEDTRRIQKQTGLKQNVGHFDQGPNAPSNLGPQLEYGEEGNKTTVQKSYDPETGKSTKVETVKKATDHVRTKEDLDQADIGRTHARAFEEYLFEGKTTYIDSKGVERSVSHMEDFTPQQRGVVGHSKEFAATAESAQNKIRLEKLNDAKVQAYNKASPSKQLTLEDQAKANILAKNPAIPDVRHVKGPAGYFDKIKSHLMSKGFVEEAAKVAGQSPNPWTNIGGDFVGVVFDGLAVAANPKDKDALIELAMSGTQLATSAVGSALIAIPDPITGGLGYVIMRAGDNVGKIEKLWNMSREGRQLTKKNKKPLEIFRLKKKNKPLSKADKAQVGSIQKETRQTPLNRIRIP